MKKTISSNIGGYAFNVECDAFEAVDRYLDEIRRCYENDKNAEEIVADIETRIGELLSEVKGGCEVITADMVEAVKARVGDPSALQEEEDAASSEGCGNAANDAEDSNPESGGEDRKSIKKRFYRDTEHRNIGGVCSGLASYFNTDVAWFRIGWLVLFFFGLFTDARWIFDDGKLGFYVLLAYCILWICVPEARTVEQKCEMRGEPVKLHQFRDYVPESEKKINRRRPLLGRILCTMTGIILLIAGSGCVISGMAVPFGQQFAQNDIQLNFSTDGCGEWTDYAENAIGMMAGNTFWWLAAANILLLGLGMCYAGVLLTFDVKGPKWHPGIIIFILWLLSFFALAAFTAASVFCGQDIPHLTL